jgi:hypothetical protein
MPRAWGGASRRTPGRLAGWASRRLPGSAPRRATHITSLRQSARGEQERPAPGGQPSIARCRPAQRYTSHWTGSIRQVDRVVFGAATMESELPTPAHTAIGGGSRVPACALSRHRRLISPAVVPTAGDQQRAVAFQGESTQRGLGRSATPSRVVTSAAGLGSYNVAQVLQVGSFAIGTAKDGGG